MQTFKEATLYDKLRMVEQLNEAARLSAEGFNNFLMEYPEFLKGVKLPEAPELHEADILALQKTIIAGYKTNPILSDALNSRKSIEKSLEELISLHDGIGFFLPRRKNYTINKKIDEIGKLIPFPEHLKTKGVFALDNLASVGSYSAIAAFGATYGLFSYAGSFSSSFNAWISAFFGLAIGISAGLNASYSARTGSNPKIEARYLDRKIALLFDREYAFSDSIWLIE